MPLDHFLPSADGTAIRYARAAFVIHFAFCVAVAWVFYALVPCFYRCRALRVVARVIRSVPARVWVLHRDIDFVPAVRAMFVCPVLLDLDGGQRANTGSFLRLGLLAYLRCALRVAAFRRQRLPAFCVPSRARAARITAAHVSRLGSFCGGLSSPHTRGLRGPA